jgi:hypothetical protein
MRCAATMPVRRRRVRAGSSRARSPRRCPPGRAVPNDGRGVARSDARESVARTDKNGTRPTAYLPARVRTCGARRDKRDGEEDAQVHENDAPAGVEPRDRGDGPLPREHRPRVARHEPGLRLWRDRSKHCHARTGETASSCSILPASTPRIAPSSWRRASGFSGACGSSAARSGTPSRPRWPNISAPGAFAASLRGPRRSGSQCGRRDSSRVTKCCSKRMPSWPRSRRFTGRG